MDNSEKVDSLIRYVAKHYDKGAHWIFETHDRKDYEDILEYCRGSLKSAKAHMKEMWEIKEERYREVQAEIF